MPYLQQIYVKRSAYHILKMKAADSIKVLVPSVQQKIKCLKFLESKIASDISK
jgi:hypothetical protein